MRFMMNRAQQLRVSQNCAGCGNLEKISKQILTMQKKRGQLFKTNQKTQQKNAQPLTNSEKRFLKKKEKEILSKKALTAQKLSMTLRNKKLSFRNKMSRTGELSEIRKLRLLKEKLQTEELKKHKRSSLG